MASRMEVCYVLTLGEILYANVVKLLDLFHDQLLFVDLNYHSGVPCISSGESELAESRLKLLGNVGSARLPSVTRVKTAVCVYRVFHRKGAFRTRIPEYVGKEQTIVMV